jgi:hypothetical protein
MAENNGLVSIKRTQLDGTEDRFGALVPGAEVWVETRPLDLGSSRRDKYIDAIVLEIEGAENFVSAQLYVKELDRLRDEDQVSYGPGQPLRDVDEPIFLRLQSRYVQLKLVDEFPQVRWKLTGIEFYGRPMTGRL